MGERYKVSGYYLHWCVMERDRDGDGWWIYTGALSKETAQRICRALNLLDETERQAEAPVNSEDDGA